MKKSKQAKGEDGVDRISIMPDEVLQLILSGIPTTEEVVRTDILSRRWRHLWTSVPFIDLDYTRKGLNNTFTEFNRSKFREFVNWVLLNKPLDLDSFRLRCGDYYYTSTISQWIKAAVVRKVKLLDLMFRPLYEESQKGIELPHCLVTCDSLEVLKLCLCGTRLCVPNITGFQALRVLELRKIDLFKDYDLVKHFLETCLLLEDLSLIDCHACTLLISCSKLKNLRIDEQNGYPYFPMCFRLEICCPKLEFLKLTGYVAQEFLFQSLYSLKKIVFQPRKLYGRDPPFDFFDKISQVESLSISLNCVRQWFNGEVDTHVSLPNLKTLEIIINGFYYMDAHTLIRFLKCVPDLESLHLIFTKDIDYVHKWNLGEAATISILTCHLKKVEFLDFDGEKPRLVLARRLLEHGSLLKEMVFSWDNEAKFNEKSMETMNQISSFHKASLIVKLRCSLINPPQLEY